MSVEAAGEDHRVVLQRNGHRTCHGCAWYLAQPNKFNCTVCTKARVAGLRASGPRHI